MIAQVDLEILKIKLLEIQENTERMMRIIDAEFKLRKNSLSSSDRKNKT